MPLGPALLLPLALCAAAFFPSQGSNSEMPTPRPALRSAPAASQRSADEASRLVTLSWDDQLNGAMGDEIHVTALRWTRMGNTLSGRFTAPVAGRISPALLLGEVLPGPSEVLVLKQVEAEWSCHYLLHRQGTHSWVGTWRDTRGRSGDVVLHEDRPFLPPLSIDGPAGAAEGATQSAPATPRCLTAPRRQAPPGKVPTGPGLVPGAPLRPGKSPGHTWRSEAPGGGGR